MKLWILRPAKESLLWNPWYDKAFGFVIRAETEEDARRIAQENAGDETRYNAPAWTDPVNSTCIELTADGPEEEIMRDFAAA